MVMRDVVILHAREQSALASALSADNLQVWMTSELDASAPQGAFGSRFRLVAIWSAAAAAAGLDALYVAQFAGRETPTVLLKADSTPVPPALARAASIIGYADADGLATALSPNAPGTHAARKSAPRRVVRDFSRAVAAVAFSLGFGAVLAHATAVERETALDSEFGLAPLEPRPTPVQVQAAPDAEVDAVFARANSLFAKAYATSRSGDAEARLRAADAFRASAD